MALYVNQQDHAVPDEHGCFVSNDCLPQCCYWCDHSVRTLMWMLSISICTDVEHEHLLLLLSMNIRMDDTTNEYDQK